MTAAATLQASQRAAGKPIRFHSQMSLTTPAEATANWDAGLGFKTGATAPTNQSELADLYFPYTEGVRGSVSNVGRWNNAVEQHQVRVAIAGTLPVEGTITAGKYMFAFLVLEDGTFQAVSAPYHVI